MDGSSDNEKKSSHVKSGSLLHRIYKHCSTKIRLNFSTKSNNVYTSNINKRQQLKRYRNGNGEQ